MQKLFRLFLFLSLCGFLWWIAGVSTAFAVCVGPSYCTGPCGILSTTCSCISQSCVTVTPSTSNGCVWAGTTSCGGVYDDIYGWQSCNSCLYCTTANDTFSCSDLGTAYSPCYTGDCAATPTPAPTGGPTPTPVPTVGWCTVVASAASVATGQPVTVTLQASSQNAGGNTAYLKVVRRDHAAIDTLPAAPNNEYPLTSCSSTTNTCSSSTTTDLLPTGEYFFFCGYDAGAPSCTGNPFCAHESVTPAVTEVACPGFTSCNTSGGDDNKDFTVVAPLVTVTANVYDDPNANCSGTSYPPSGYTGGTVVLSRISAPSLSYSPPLVGMSSTGTFSDVTGGNLWHSISFDNDDPNWVESCSNALTPFTIASANIVKNFYVTQKRGPWWQAMGGDVYAAGSISTTVPSTAAAPASALAHIGATTSSSGVMIAGSEAIDAIDVMGALGPTGERDWSVSASSYQTTTRENYGYFVRLLELGTLEVGKDSFGGATSMNAFPATSLKDFSDGNAVYYRDGALTITGLTVGAAEKRTLIVNGDVTVSGNISVSGGGFFQVISSGDITFDGSVTNAQGIYVANGTLTVADAGDGAVGFAARRFLGQGVFVGWGGVSLQRDLNRSTAADDLENNLYAAERFTYRADLIINAPPSLMRSGIQWQEVVPQPNGLSATPTPAPTAPLCTGIQPTTCPDSVCCTNGSWTCCAGGNGELF